MAQDKFEWNMAGLIELSNDVLAADCIPIAEKVAETARAAAPVKSGDYQKSIHVETELRTSETDWAHAHVIADSDHAGIVNARTGNLTRALNEAGR